MMLTKSVVALLFLVNIVSAFEWFNHKKVVDSELVTMERKHICNFKDANGREYIGTVLKGGDACQGVSRGDGFKVKLKNTYSVFSNTKNEKIGWKYCTGDKKPTRAIPCDLNKGFGEGNCFLGRGVYGDGICSEEFGFIQGNMVHAVNNGKHSRCPFRFYMVERSEPSKCV